MFKTTAGGYICKLFPDSLRSRDGLSNNIQLMNAIGLLVVKPFWLFRKLVAAGSRVLLVWGIFDEVRDDSQSTSNDLVINSIRPVAFGRKII